MQGVPLQMCQDSDPFYLTLQCNYHEGLEINIHIRPFLLLDIEYLVDPLLPPLLLAGDCTVPLEMPVLTDHMRDLLMEYYAF